MTDAEARTVETVQVRPYARLLTMLGEQLIKNDRIALVELIKNSYDADASLVQVDFLGFSSTLVGRPDSVIAITDNGDGMSEDGVRRDWLNPATPSKSDRKRRADRSAGGRVLQGEKGIGRFAMFKLGSRVRMITRARSSAFEYVVDLDLSFLDESDGGQSGVDETPKHLFIEEIPVSLMKRPPEYFTHHMGLGGANHGTRIEVSLLRSKWTEATARHAYQDVARLQPLIPRVVDDSVQTDNDAIGPEESDFSVLFSRDGVDLGFRQDQDFELKRLFEDRAVLRVNGHFSDAERSFLLTVNDHTSIVSLEDSILRGLRIFKESFREDGDAASIYDLSCGPFDFSFFVFDLTPRAPVEYRLDADEREQVKGHRIYLYRDGVRVLPYGDPDDDWLQLDVIRGTQGAGRILSNDQIVGFVYISQRDNPNLRDKTNREGLLDTGGALQELIALLQIAISYLRRSDYARYVATAEQRRDSIARRERVVITGFETLLAEPELPKRVRTQIEKLHGAYRDEREYTNVRLDRTEDLAGVGLSVEAASHDIIATASQALSHARAADRHAHAWHPEDTVLTSHITSVIEGISFVSSRLDDVQGLFVSTRKGKRVLEPAEFVSRVQRMYAGAMRARSIRLQLDREGDQRLKVRTTDAALLQVLVNLFDNAIYWLASARTHDPVVHVVVDEPRRRVIFADNGPGVADEDEPYIFEPFFSGKGTAGKGLGLYIARQVSVRNGFTIDLLTDERHKVESGANFVLSFNGGNDA